MIRKFQYLLLLATIIVFFSSCLKDGDKTIVLPELEKSKEIYEIVPKEILVVIEEMGMPIYRGGNPPDIQNTYLISPYILSKSNIPGDETGNQFADFIVTFSDIDYENFSITMNFEHGGSTGHSEEGYIVGNHDYFTVFIKIISKHNNYECFLARLISGKMDSGGIKDLYMSIFMIDDYGDPNNELIEVGQGRLLYDGDGFSEIIDGIKQSGLQNNTELPDMSDDQSHDK